MKYISAALPPSECVGHTSVYARLVACTYKIGIPHQEPGFTFFLYQQGQDYCCNKESKQHLICASRRSHGISAGATSPTSPSPFRRATWPSFPFGRCSAGGAARALLTDTVCILLHFDTVCAPAELDRRRGPTTRLVLLSCFGSCNGQKAVREVHCLKGRFESIL